MDSVSEDAQSKMTLDHEANEQKIEVDNKFLSLGAKKRGPGLESSSVFIGAKVKNEPVTHIRNQSMGFFQTSTKVLENRSVDNINTKNITGTSTNDLMSSIIARNKYVKPNSAIDQNQQECESPKSIHKMNHILSQVGKDSNHPTTRQWRASTISVKSHFIQTGEERKPLYIKMETNDHSSNSSMTVENENNENDKISTGKNSAHKSRKDTKDDI